MTIPDPPAVRPQEAIAAARRAAHAATELEREVTRAAAPAGRQNARGAAVPAHVQALHARHDEARALADQAQQKHDGVLAGWAEHREAKRAAAEADEEQRRADRVRQVFHRTPELMRLHGVEPEPADEAVPFPQRQPRPKAEG
jgi:hypothetical protein